MRARTAKIIVLSSAILYVALFGLGRKSQPPIAMTVRKLVTNEYIFFKDGPAYYISAIIDVTNSSGGTFICRAEQGIEPTIFGDRSNRRFNSRTFGPHTNFTVEALVFRGFTNKIELIFTPTQRPWPFRHLPAAVLQVIPQKLYTPQEFKIISPEF